MPVYQCAFLDQFGRLLRKRTVDCSNDVDAMAQAMRQFAQVANCRSVKVFDGLCVVGVYERRPNIRDQNERAGPAPAALARR